jgi:hypothetical protein
MTHLESPGVATPGPHALRATQPNPPTHPRSRRRWLRITAITLGILLLATAACCTGLWWFNRQSALRTTLEWARMAPLPLSAEITVLDSSGGLFSREFTLRFEAPAPDVTAWLQASPGTQNRPPDQHWSGEDIYIVQPGGGAAYAKVRVGDHGQRVTIWTYWS